MTGFVLACGLGHLAVLTCPRQVIHCPLGRSRCSLPATSCSQTPSLRGSAHTNCATSRNMKLKKGRNDRIGSLTSAFRYAIIANKKIKVNRYRCIFKGIAQKISTVLDFRVAFCYNRLDERIELNRILRAEWEGEVQDEKVGKKGADVSDC